MVANALGELFGLGGTFAALAGLSTLLTGMPVVMMVVVSFVFAVVTGIIEATIVGFLQWRVLREAFPTLRANDWWQATAAGALIAYVAGYLPSTVIGMGEAVSQTAVVEPPQWLQLLFAAGLGLVAGAILAFAQWLVLRKFVKRAGIWIAANMLAWVVGMPLIFLGMDIAMRGQPIYQTILIIAGMLLFVGAVVGAIHGSFLIRLVKHDRLSE